MMSRLSSRRKTLNSIPAASATRAMTGRPRKTSGHQSSPNARTLAGPPSREASSRNAETSSSLSAVSRRFLSIQIQLARQIHQREYRIAQYLLLLLWRLGFSQFFELLSKRLPHFVQRLERKPGADSASLNRLSLNQRGK